VRGDSECMNQGGAESFLFHHVYVNAPTGAVVTVLSTNKHQYLSKRASLGKYSTTRPSDSLRVQGKSMID
jgi:hypothetical protein